MEYLSTLAVFSLFGWLMWWSHARDKRQHPGYSLRGDIRNLMAVLREMTLKEAVVIAWKLCLYLVCLLAFFWVAAMMGFTGPVCWRC